jgi:hypothetical protein
MAIWQNMIMINSAQLNSVCFVFFYYNVEKGSLHVSQIVLYAKGKSF